MINVKNINYLFLTILLIIIPTCGIFYKDIVKELFVLFIGLWGLYVFITNPLKQFSLSKIDILVLCYVLYEITHYLLFSKFNSFSLFFWKRLSFSCVYFILRQLFSKYNFSFSKGIIGVVVFKFLYELIISVFQYFNILNFTKSDYFEIVGTYTSPNYLAYLLSIGILISIWLIFNYWEKITLIFIKYSLVLVNLIAVLLLTIMGSKTAIISLIISILLFFTQKYWLWLKQVKVIYKISVLILLFLISILSIYSIKSKNEGSTNGRLIVADLTLNEALKKPILGHGIFSFQREYNLIKGEFIKENNPDWNFVKNADYAYSAMNDYLEFFFETGSIGLILLGLIFLFVFLKKQDNAYDQLGFYILLFLIICALFSSVHRNNDMVLLGVTGLVLAHGQSKRKTILTTGFITTVIPILFFAILTTVGATKLYAKNELKNNFKNKENLNSIPEKKWKNLFYISSGKGMSEFSYGRVLYTGFNKRKEGLEIMEKAISKNIRPKNVRFLASCHLKSKNYNRAEELFELNTYSEPFKFKPKMDYLKFLKKSRQQQKACTYANEILNFPIKVPSKEVEEYKIITKKIIKRINCN